MNQESKEKLKALEANIDQEFGKIKRVIVHGWMSKPAYIRALGWFISGGVVMAMINSYFV